MKNRKKILGVILLVVLISLFFILPAVQAASGVELPTDTGLSSKTIKEILTKVLTWLLEIVGVIAIIGFVVSGIQYIIAAGDEKKVESAKKNMTYSLIGISVVMASFVIVQAINSIMNATGSY